MDITQVSVIKCKIGDIIFNQGDEGKSLYQIKTGSVDVYLHYKEPNEILLSTLDNDEFFGEMSFLDNSTRSATTVAKSDVTLIEFPEELIELFILSNPAFAIKIMRSLSTRLRFTNDKLQDMYKLLLSVSGNDKKIDTFIKRHTGFDKDNNPFFVMKL